MKLDDKALERFFAKVNKTDTCWLWTAALNFPNGYGLFGVPGGNGKTITAHRMSWIIHNGAIPDKMYICHRCDVKSCVNPDHLFLGTQSDNINDSVSKGRFHRNTSGERNGKARLKENQVREIRRQFDSGERTFRQLQFDYGATYSMIYHIIKRNNWKGVEP